MLRADRLLAVLVSALVMLVLPLGASARTQASQGGAASAVATELAKAGGKAAIAHFAPELNKYVDPTRTALAEIQSQLAALDAKLTELKDYQQRVEEHLNCVVQRTQLNTILASADTHLRALADIGRLADQSARHDQLETLAGTYLTLTTQQSELHIAVAGPDGALRACARHIEMSQRPFLTDRLAPAVRDFYAAYHAAAVALLAVRVNIVNYKPTHYPAGKADEIIRQVNGWIADEEALIKPAMPYTESYFVPEDLLMKTRVASGGLQDYQANDLFKAGWWATIRGTPGCSQLIRIADATGVPRSQARAALRSLDVLNMPRYVYCYDDHDTLYAFDFDLFRYESSSHTHVYVTRDIGTVMAHRGTGFFDFSKYSYTLR
jgi:hypothetical protein